MPCIRRFASSRLNRVSRVCLILLILASAMLGLCRYALGYLAGAFCAAGLAVRSMRSRGCFADLFHASFLFGYVRMYVCRDAGSAVSICSRLRRERYQRPSEIAAQRPQWIFGVWGDCCASVLFRHDWRCASWGFFASGWNSFSDGEKRRWRLYGTYGIIVLVRRRISSLGRALELVCGCGLCFVDGHMPLLG